MKEIMVVCGVFSQTTVDGIEVALFERKEPAVEFEFPGGKVDPGESPTEALARELEEELAVSVIVGAEVGNVVFDYPTVRINLTAYWVTSENLDFRLVDHFRWTWVNSENWRDYLVAGPDIPLLKQIFSQ